MTMLEATTETASTEATQGTQFLYFYLTAQEGSGCMPDRQQDEGYALAMSDVAEIIRVPELNRVPLSSHATMGVTNLRGSVLPVVSLRRLVGRDDEETTKYSRILVLKGKHPIGLWVDWVEKVDQVPESQIDTSELMQQRAEHALLRGFVRPDSGADHTRMRRLLDRDAVFQASLCAPVVTEEPQTGGGAARSDEQDRRVEDTEQFICFDLGSQAFALNIRQVKEVVRLPDQLEAVSGTPEHVIGVLSLRELMIPLLRLSSLYGLLSTEEALATPSKDCRVVVVPVGSRDGQEFVGLVVERITRVVALSESRVQPVPDMLSQLPGFTDITGMMRLDTRNDSLTALLDVRKLMAQQAFQEAATVARDNEVTMNTETEHSEDRQLVVFQLEQEEYGVAIEATKEILRVPETLTHVPQADSFIKGVINLRGMVLPVIDLRQRFALAPQEANARQRIVVLNLNGQRTGFIVDAVREVLTVSATDIETAPPLSPEQNSLITEMANLTSDNRMILLIDVGRLVTEHEARKLARAAAQETSETSG